MKDISILIGAFLFFTINLFSQMNLEPEYLSENKYLKKEKKKYGLYNKNDKEWIIEPLYDKITAIAFSEKKYDYMMGEGNTTVYFNLMFYKLWKGNTFDLLYVSPDQNDIFKKNFELWVKDIEEVVFPAYNPAAGSEYIQQDFVNFIYYKKNGKWGWFVNEYFSSENILYDPVFENPPAAKYSYKNSFHEFFNEYIVQTDSAGLNTLYTLRGRQLIPPGKYKSIEINGPGFILTENESGLKGYNNVPPQYLSIETASTFIKETLYLLTLPDNTRKIVKENGSPLTEKEIFDESRFNEKLAAFASYIKTSQTVAGNMEVTIQPDRTGVIHKIDGKEVNIGFEFGSYNPEKKPLRLK